MIERLLAAESALSRGLLDQAEQTYRGVLAADPRNAIAAIGLARVAFARGDEAGAAALAGDALAIDPENAAARRLRDRLDQRARFRTAIGAPTSPAVTLRPASAPTPHAPASAPTPHTPASAPSPHPPRTEPSGFDAPSIVPGAPAPPGATATLDVPAGTDPDATGPSAGRGPSEASPPSIDAAPAAGEPEPGIAARPEPGMAGQAGAGAAPAGTPAPLPAGRPTSPPRPAPARRGLLRRLLRRS